MLSTREVSMDEFWLAVGCKNVHPEIVGPYPYISVYRSPDRAEHGRIVDELIDGKYPVVSRYYLP